MDLYRVMAGLAALHNQSVDLYYTLTVSLDTA